MMKVNTFSWDKNFASLTVVITMRTQRKKCDAHFKKAKDIVLDNPFIHLKSYHKKKIIQIKAPF